MPSNEKLRTSGSQVDLVQTCPRRWYFKYVLRLPEPPSKSTTLGDIGHGVCERWYEKLSLYPSGWEQQKNRWTNKPTGESINNQEQALVKALIDKGVTEGVLTRLPEGEVEKEIDFPALAFQGFDVRFIGFIDYFSAPSLHIEDHKFCKTFKYYGKAKLGRAVAMNAYGYSAYKQGWIDPADNIWLRYNLFRKNYETPSVKVVEVEKTFEDIERYWDDKIVPSMKDMVLYKKNADTYNDVPMAQDKRKACQAFGQICPFFDICGGKETPNDLKRRMDGSAVENRKETYNQILQKRGVVTQEKKMASFMDKIKQGNAAGAAAPATNTTPAAAEKPAEKPSAAQAPWAVNECPACAKEKVRGVVNGEPCQVCMFMGKSIADHPDPANYLIVPTEGGYEFTSTEGEQSSAQAVEEVRKAPEDVAPVVEPNTGEVMAGSAPAAKPAAQTPAQSAAEIELDSKSFAEVFYDPERMGFVLSLVRVGTRKRVSKKLGEAGHIVRFRDFFEGVADVVLQECVSAGVAVESYYDLDTWKRRDYLSRNAKRFASFLGNSIVEAIDVNGADEKHLLMLIEPYASMTFG